MMLKRNVWPVHSCARGLHFSCSPPAAPNAHANKITPIAIGTHGLLILESHKRPVAIIVATSDYIT